MIFDGSSAGSHPATTFRGPAQHTISQFLVEHRAKPVRSTGQRVLGRSPLGETDARWYWAAVGQLELKSRLEQLGAEWTVVHGVPGPSETIDHLVIGPGGVFTISAHDHARQRVWVSGRAFVADGHRLPYLRQAEEAIGHVERTLETVGGVHLRASTVIAVIDPGSLQVRDLPRDVFVVRADSLTEWLKTRDAVLGAETAAHVASLARIEATWTTEPRSVADVELIARERAEFDVVQREVATARLVRSAWAVGVITLLAGMMLAVGLLQWTRLTS